MGATASPLRNVYACLVHERLECVIDLVRNLQFLDPASSILLYDGGDPPVLDTRFPFQCYGAVRHPAPCPQRWGKLHGFALDCMRYAFETREWDTMTIVDSDQLALRPGFSEELAECLAGRPQIGMLGNAPMPQAPDTRVSPAMAAWCEVGLWRPLLRRFPDGERKFVHWTFWPATVFTADAARDLIRLFDEDEQLKYILSRSAIWATEEVILPTVISLLGYEIAPGPTSYDFINYRTPYAAHEIDSALARPDVFWAHPVPRRYQDPFRSRIRARFGQYRRPRDQAAASSSAAPVAPLRLITPLLERMERIAGWLERAEAELLIGATERALAACPSATTIVEVGSYLGRATVVLAGAVQTLAAKVRIHAIDAHDGYVGALDMGLVIAPSSAAQLRANLENAGVADLVEIHHARAPYVSWREPVALLLVDGLHDYASTAQDFYTFEPFLAEGAHVAFHDYASYFPGVVAFVDELLESGSWREIAVAGSMILLQRVSPPAQLSPGA